MATLRKNALPASPLHRHIGFWMRMVSNHVSQAFATKLEHEGSTVAQWVILRVLYESDIRTPSVLAEATHLSRGAVSKLVDGLLARGLLTRVEANGDRRYQNLDLTPTGRALVPRLAALADSNDDEFFGVLAPAERERLLALLKKTVRLKSLQRIPLG